MELFLQFEGLISSVRGALPFGLSHGVHAVCTFMRASQRVSELRKAARRRNKLASVHLCLCAWFNGHISLCERWNGGGGGGGGGVREGEVRVSVGSSRALVGSGSGRVQSNQAVCADQVSWRAACQVYNLRRGAKPANEQRASEWV